MTIHLLNQWYLDFVGLGFTLALILLGHKERQETADIPEGKGNAYNAIAASLVSITFVGFAGLIIS